MEVTIQNLTGYPEWSKTRGAMVRFTMDLFAKGGKRRLAERGDEAYVLSTTERPERTITVQPMLRHYCIHDAPIEILEPITKRGGVVLANEL